MAFSYSTTVLALPDKDGDSFIFFVFWLESAGKRFFGKGKILCLVVLYVDIGFVLQFPPHWIGDLLRIKASRVGEARLSGAERACVSCYILPARPDDPFPCGCAQSVLFACFPTSGGARSLWLVNQNHINGRRWPRTDGFQCAFKIGRISCEEPNKPGISGMRKKKTERKLRFGRSKNVLFKTVFFHSV